MPGSYIVPLNKVESEDISLIGLKGAGLGEMIKAGFPTPPGFIISSQAFRDFIDQNKIDTKIRHLLNSVNQNDPHSFNQTRQLIRKYVIDADIPREINLEIYNSYKKLTRFKDAFVAVRSSFTNENLPYKNYVLNDSFLNVKGETNILLKLKECWALFIIASIMDKNSNVNRNYLDEGLGVIIQYMSESDKSGVVYTADPNSSDKTKVLIKAIYGLGEYIHSTEVNPDVYELNKNEMTIHTKIINTQAKKLKKCDNIDKFVNVFTLSRSKQKLSDKEIISLGQLAIKIEKHFYFPQIIEWSIEKGKIYILEVKPLNKTESLVSNNLNNLQVTNTEPLLCGTGIQPGICSGHVRIVNEDSDIYKLQSGEILVINDYQGHKSDLLKKAGAYVQNLDLKKHHILFFKKELGIPTVANTISATNTLKNNSVVTVNANTGEIFAGTPFVVNI